MAVPTPDRPEDDAPDSPPEAADAPTDAPAGDAAEDWTYDQTDAGVTELVANDRQLRFLHFYAKTGELVDSARRAGYVGDDSTLRHTAYRLKRRFRNPMRALMRQRGLDVPSILAIVERGLVATQVHRIKVKELVEKQKSDGETEWVAEDVVREYVDINWAARARFATIALQLQGALGTRGGPENDEMAERDREALLTALVGVEAEQEAESREAEEQRQMSEAEMRHDIVAIQRKLAVLGWQLVPVTPGLPESGQETPADNPQEAA